MGAFLGAQVAPPETKQINSIPNQLSSRIPALKFRCSAGLPLQMNCQISNCQDKVFSHALLFSCGIRCNQSHTVFP